jgi:hypothetical protein
MDKLVIALVVVKKTHVYGIFVSNINISSTEELVLNSKVSLW